VILPPLVFPAESVSFRAESQSPRSLRSVSARINQILFFNHQVASWIQDMLCNFCLVKIDKIADNSFTTEAREKVSADLEFLEFQIFFVACLTI
jgi:hypothetical protein